MPWYRFRIENRPALQNAVQNRFETIFMAAGGPPEMLLIEQRHRVGDSTQWMRLSDARFRSAFPEFEDANEADLPRRAALLVGHNNEFERLFEYGTD